jgi:hypothetical protein
MSYSGLGRSGEAPLKVFVSSVMDDEMEAWRVAVVETLTDVSFLRVWAFEFTPPTSEALESAYLRHVREAEFVVWLVGRSTSEPVRREIREAMVAHRRLLVLRLPLEPRDDATRDLLAETQTSTKWSHVIQNRDELGVTLKQAIADEIVRVFRGIPGLAPLEELERLGRESRSRCVARWASAGVNPVQAELWARDPSLQRLPAEMRSHSSGLLAVVGGMGAGKSFVAEAWLQQRVRLSSRDPNLPVPVFLSAEDVTSSLGNTATEAAARVGNAELQGLSLVIDDLSRCSDRRAARLLEQAWALCSSCRGTSVIVTSRPIHGLLTGDMPTTVGAPRLSADESLALLERVCDSQIPRHRYRSWAPSLREAIRWPLFAVLTGVYLRDHDMPGRITYSELLSFLINRSLSGTEAATTAASRLLKKVARLSVDSDRSLVALSDIGRPAELGGLLASGLVELRDDMVGFPLDILREWLAAQSIGDGEPTVWELLDEPARLFRWKYPLMASIGSGDFDSGSEILGPLVARKTGLAARIVSEETPEYSVGRDRVLTASPMVLGEQVRLATEYWTYALWPASSYSSAVDENGEVRDLGIQVHGKTLEMRWRREKSKQAVALIKDSDADGIWVSFRSGRPADTSSWPWSWALAGLKNPLARAVRARNVPLAQGPLLLEFAYEAARDVLRIKARSGEPIPLQDLVDWLTKLRADPGHVVRYTKGRLTFDPAQLEEAVEALQSRGRSELTKPYPSATFGSHNTWEWFGGDKGMMRAVKGVLTTSLNGYRQTVREWFPRLRGDLAHYVLQPADIRVRLYRPEQEGYAGKLAVVLLPRERGKRNRLDITIDDDGTHLSWEEQGAWLDEQTDRIREYRKEAAWWLKPKIDQHEIPLFGRTPACRLAMFWLYQDLFELSLVDRAPGSYSAFW